MNLVILFLRKKSVELVGKECAASGRILIALKEEDFSQNFPGFSLIDI